MKKKPEVTESLGSQVARLREAAGMTHQALADAAGVARQTIRFLEGHSTPYGTSVETFLKICRVLEADPCEVLFRLPEVRLPADEHPPETSAEETEKPAKKTTGKKKPN
ncbi:helix-turn-helix transcriptional regulator [Zavarzinella formosa]|uniref:helix-turn-helix transcriptional regulator n=1 Tax=Zavarzinella formosa TaxID=360055 RepID=UPI0002FA2D35|nr:helix-turn-helix transcriptional regulator [Zavarzinella formosa]